MIVLGRLGEGHTANNGPTRPLRTNYNRYLSIRPNRQFYAALSPCIRWRDPSLPLEKDNRVAPLGAIANGSMTASQAMVWVDTVPRLDFIAHHAWRSAFYLVEDSASPG
jgi:phosphate:Na+ symporter